MRYDVDVKAFLRVQVEAETIEDAISEAKAFVEGLDPDPAYVSGWRDTRAAEGTADGRVLETGCFDTEDTAHVEDAETGDVLQEDA